MRNNIIYNFKRYYYKHIRVKYSDFWMIIYTTFFTDGSVLSWACFWPLSVAACVSVYCLPLRASSSRSVQDMRYQAFSRLGRWGQMDVVSSRSCGCNPGFVYASLTTFQCHFKTNKHLVYQHSRTEHDLRIQLGLRDKEIAILQRRLSDCESSLLALQKVPLRKKICKSREELKQEITLLINELKAPSWRVPVSCKTLGYKHHPK